MDAMLEYALEFIYFLGSSVCHQLPERSLHIANLPLPLCARCTGLHLGFWVGLAYARWLRRINVGWPPNRPLLILFLISAGIIGLDVFTHQFGWQPGSNPIRLLTGLLSGYAFGCIFAYALSAVFNELAGRRRLGSIDIVSGVAIVLSLWAIILRAPESAYLLLTVFEGISVIAVFTLFWAVLLATIFRIWKKRLASPKIFFISGFVIALLQPYVIVQLHHRLAALS